VTHLRATGHIKDPEKADLSRVRLLAVGTFAEREASVGRVEGRV
jgi:hypothetical protein